MARTPRIAFLHTGAVVIAPVADLARVHLGGATTINYLDDKIVADLGDADRAASVPERIADLVQAAQSAGADLVMLTCSSISHLAAPTAERVGIPVLRIDEAMADQAVSIGSRITVLATLSTTLTPTTALIRERAALADVISRDRQRGDRRGLRRRRGRRSRDATTASSPPRSSAPRRPPTSSSSRRRRWPVRPMPRTSTCRC